MDRGSDAADAPKDKPRRNSSLEVTTRDQSYNEKLYSIRSRASSEIDRMVETSSMVDGQSRKLLRTNETSAEYRGKLVFTGTLTKQLVETHKKNRIRVYGSFFFFLAVVAYIWLSRMGFFFLLSVLAWPFQKLFSLFFSAPQPPFLQPGLADL